MFPKNLVQVYRLVAIVFFSLFLISCGSGSGKSAVPVSDGETAPEFRVVFEDNFDAATGKARLGGRDAPVAQNWRMRTGDGSDTGNAGWGNDEWQIYSNSEQNVFLEGGNLVISAQCSTTDCSNPSTATGGDKRTGTITSGRIDSAGKFNVRYGKVEANIKMPSGFGTWPAFWMLGADFPDLAWPDAGEIDIVEMFYSFSNNRTTHFTTHWSAPEYAEGERPSCAAGVPGVEEGEEQHCFTQSKTFDAPLTDDFHIFSLEWTESTIIGKIDGVTYYTLAIDPATMEEFLKDYFMILNVAIGGTLGGTPNMDWSDPNQTDMLVDWVRVSELVSPASSTLNAETGNDFPNSGVSTSIDIGGGRTNVDLTSAEVVALVGETSLELEFFKTVEPGASDVKTFTGAEYGFARADLTDFNNLYFSVNASQFPNFSGLVVQFSDSRFTGEGAGLRTIQLNRFDPVSVQGSWATYMIPFSEFAGVNMDDVAGLGFYNPTDASGTLLEGKLYLDGIRFSNEGCSATPGITLNAASYNPASTTASVEVNDICAAGTLATVTLQMGAETIVRGIELDAAGVGTSVFGLLDATSTTICRPGDETGVLTLGDSLTATYSRSKLVDLPAVSNVVVTAPVDAGAPLASPESGPLYMYSTAGTFDFLPDTDFSFSDFSTGTSFDGAFSTDATFSPAISVSNSANLPAVMAFAGFDAGFATDRVSFNFTIKNVPGDIINIKFGGGAETVFAVDLVNYAGSSAIGNGWYKVSIPMTEFPSQSTHTFLSFENAVASTEDFSYLVTDIFVTDALNGYENCSIGIAATDNRTGTALFEDNKQYILSSGAALTFIPNTDYDFSDFNSGSAFGTVTTDTSFSPVTSVSTTATQPLLALFGFTPGFADGSESINFAIKGLPGDTVRVVLGSGAGESEQQIAVLSDGRSTSLGNGWYSVSIPTSDFSTAATADFIFFQGQSAGTFFITNVFLESPAVRLEVPGGGSSSSSSGGSTSSGGSSSGGGVATGGSVPEVTIYEADGSTADLAPAYDPFGSGSSFATIATDTSYGNVLENSVGAGYGGGALLQLGLTGLSGLDSYGQVLFKAKGFTANSVIVKLEATGGGVVTVDLASPGTGITVDDLGDGWSQVVINMSEFGDVSSSTVMIFQTADGAYPAGTKLLLTDIGFNNAGGGVATGGTVPDVTIFEADGSTADLAPAYDPFGSGSSFATIATDTSYGNVLENSVGAGYGGGALLQLGLTGLSGLDSYGEVLFKAKGFTANSVIVKLEATGGGVVTVDLASPGTGITVDDLGDGWSQVVIAMSEFGDVSSSTVMIFQTADGAYPAATKLLLTDIGFNNAGGGSSSGGGSGGGQLAVNGDIEAGDLSSWTTAENGGSITADNTQDSGSTWSINIVAGPGNNPSASLADLGVGTVMPGDTIDVSFDMCGSAASGGVIFPALLSEFGGGTGADRVNLDTIASPPSVWTRYNYSQAAGSNVTGGISLQLDVVCGADAGCAANVYFDNVSVTIGGGAVPGSASGASCEAPPPPGATFPVDFEAAPYTFSDFGGGQASVEANSQSAGINTSATVGKMLKFSGGDFGGTTFDLGGTLAVPANSAFTMKVWASRAVPVLFKLEGGLVGEITANHTGSSTWEELTFDFDGVIGEGGITGITFIFDNGVVGDAAGDPGNWTFYFDDIAFAPLPPAPNVTLFEDAFAPGWVGFLDANGTVTQVTDSDGTYGEVLEITTGGSTVVGLGSRAGIGGDGSVIDTTRFGVLEFDLKLVTAPTSGTTNWRLKVENAPLEIGITAPILDTWTRYSIPMADLGTPTTLDLIMLFPDYGANAGAVYRLDNVKLLEVASPPPPEDITVFEDALAAGWVGFLDANGTVTQVTDADGAYGEVLELTTGGSTVVGLTTRSGVGGDGSIIDTTGYGAIEFDLKLVTAPTSGTTNWRFKTENPGQEIGIAEPVLDTWVSYSVPISSLGTPNALDLIMLFPDYGANAGAVYRIDNVKLVVNASGGGGGGGGEISVNGGLEDGLTGWDATPNGGTSELSTAEANTGTNSARLRADVAANGGSASFPDIKLANAGVGIVTANQAVTVSFWTKTVEQTGAVPFFAQLFTEQSGGGASKTDFLIQPPTFLTTGDWTQHSFDVTLGPDATAGVSLLFKADCGATPSCVLDVYIDDVLIEPTP